MQGRQNGGRAKGALITLLAWLFLVGWVPRPAWAEAGQRLILEDTTHSVALAPWSILYEDPGGTLDWENFTRQRDTLPQHPVTNDAPSFGFSDAAFWLVATVESQATQPFRWMLEFADALMEHVDVYVQHADGRVTSFRGGSTIPVAERIVRHSAHVFPLTIAAGETVTLYVRAKSRLAIVMPVFIHTDVAIIDRSQTQGYFHALYFGIIFSMFLYNGFLYLSLRDVSYFHYALFLLFMFTYYSMFTGYSHWLVESVGTQFSQDLFAIFLNLSGLWALLFMLHFLPMLKQRSWLYRIIQCNIGAQALGVLLVFLLQVRLSAIIGTVFGMGSAILAIISGTLYARQGYEPARYFFVAWVALCSASVIFGLRTLGWVPSNAITDNIQQIGSAIEVVLLSFALAARMRALKREKENMQKLAIHNLEKADKLKDEFLANTSHELRTPLNGIIGLAEALQANAQSRLNGDDHATLAMIVSSGRRLASLVNDILDFSKLRHEEIVLSKKAVDVGAVARLVVSLSQPLLKGRHLQLNVEIPDELPPALADENRLQQIFHNLIGNALKFTEQGAVTVAASLQEAHINIRVKDTGIGIPADKIDKIFESFNQGDGSIQRVYGGTGLGLSITKKLVELHGGRLQVTSTPGEGSVFSFDLPLFDVARMTAESPLPFTPMHKAVYAPFITAGETSATEGVTPGPTASANAGHWVLVVDDEPINRQVLLSQLGSAGYGVVEASDGQQALEVLAGEQRFDMVLLDVMMPKLSGYDTCREIRKTFPSHGLPVIFLTAKSQTEDVLAGFAAGGNDYLVKPFSRDELLARMAIHLELLTTYRIIGQYSKTLEARVEARTHDLIATQQQLIVKQKMAALGVLTAGVAHEINNPNNFIQAGTQNVEAWKAAFKALIDDLMGEDADPELHAVFAERFRHLAEQINLIAEGSQRISRIVKGLQTLTRLDEAEQKDADLVANLHNTLELVMPSLQGVLTVSAAITIHPVLYCWPAELNQVFINLVMNACHAVKDAPRPLPGQLLITAEWAGDGGVILRFADNGCGMSADTVLRACDPFFTTRPVGSGAGLGLSISRDVMLRHGGSLELVSIEGEGTTVVLRFPGTLVR